jgi:hypothetical protein
MSLFSKEMPYTHAQNIDRLTDEDLISLYCHSSSELFSSYLFHISK